MTLITNPLLNPTPPTGPNPFLVPSPIALPFMDDKFVTGTAMFQINQQREYMEDTGRSLELQRAVVGVSATEAPEDQRIAIEGLRSQMTGIGSYWDAARQTADTRLASLPGWNDASPLLPGASSLSTADVPDSGPATDILGLSVTTRPPSLTSALQGQFTPLSGAWVQFMELSPEARKLVFDCDIAFQHGGWPAVAALYEIFPDNFVNYPGEDRRLQMLTSFRAFGEVQSWAQPRLNQDIASLEALRIHHPEGQ